MDIKHIDKAFLHSSGHSLVFDNVLHVPQTQKNLISVQCLASDNDAFLEYHPLSFFVKDQATRKVLLQGKATGGLYPIPSKSILFLFQSLIRQSCVTVKPSVVRWHNRLGHPAYPIVNKVIGLNSLPSSSESHLELVCDSC